MIHHNFFFFAVVDGLDLIFRNFVYLTFCFMLVQINEFMYIKHIKHFVKETFVPAFLKSVLQTNICPPPKKKITYIQYVQNFWINPQNVMAFT